MKCVNHEERDAIGICASTGRAICHQCAIKNLHGDACARKSNGILRVWDVSQLWKESESLSFVELPLQELAQCGAEWFGKDAPASSVKKFALLWPDLPPEGEFPMALSASGRDVEKWQWQKIMAADLSFPIILDANGGMLDGRHRIAKSILLEKNTILAKQFREDPTPAIVLEDLR